MKKLLIVLIAFTTTLVGMTVITDLYTRKQINSLIDEICNDYRPYVRLMEYNYQSKNLTPVGLKNNKYVYRDDIVRAFSLAAMLDDNKWALEKEEWAYYSWKSVIANNPELSYAALELYGDLIIRQIGSRLDFLASQRTNSSFKYSDSYTKKKFWNANKSSIKQYQILINKLLELNDKDLNYFITTNDISDAASYEFNTWLKNKNLLNIDNMGTEYFTWQNANNFGLYPGDLLCLTKRVYERHPQWTPRKFLTEVKKFSNKVLLKIEENN